MSYRWDVFFFLGLPLGAWKVENHQLAPGFNCQGKRVTGARGAYLLISCIGSKQSLPSRLCRLCLRPQIRLCGGLLLQQRRRRLWKTSFHPSKVCGRRNFVVKVKEKKKIERLWDVEAAADQDHLTDVTATSWRRRSARKTLKNIYFFFAIFVASTIVCDVYNTTTPTMTNTSTTKKTKLLLVAASFGIN